MSLKLQLRRLRLVLSELEKLFFRLLKRLRTLTTKLKVRLSFALSASFRFTLKKTCLLFFESKFLKKFPSMRELEIVSYKVLRQKT